MMPKSTLAIVALLSLFLATSALAAKQRLWVLEADSGAAETLRKLGGEPVGRLPTGGYLFDLGSLDRGALGRTRQRRSLRPFTHAEQRAPGLTAAVSRGLVSEIAVVGLPGTSVAELSGQVSRVAPELEVLARHVGDRYPRVVVTGSPIELLAALGRIVSTGRVLWLQPFQPPIPLNDDSIEPLQANCGPAPLIACSGTLQLTPIWNQGLTGGGQIIAIADTGLDRNEDWFTEYDDGGGTIEALTDAAFPVPPATGPFFPERKVVAYWVMPGATAYDEDVFFGHGTHVTGTALGDRGLPANPTDANHEPGDGMAPNARVLFQDIGIGSQLVGQGGALMWQQALAAGAFIHSNSYGSPPPALDSYMTEDAELDDFLYRNPDMLLVFAAGNEGPTTSIHHPASAKNVLTVGMLGHGSSLTLAGISSRGPAPDGRIKPDVLAPGAVIRSADNDGTDDGLDPSFGFDFISGTSMSTPAVAGMAALARQYFVEGFYPTGAGLPNDAITPTGPLLKALLINGAENAGYSGTPSNATGWGRVWLDNSLYFSSTSDARGLRIWDVPPVAGLSEGEQHEYTVSVAAGEEFRATLVWYDPAPVMGGAALVNNLDLEVESASGDVFLGNTFSAGQSVPLPMGSADTLNPVEGVIVRPPMVVAGDHTIRVSGTQVPGTGELGTDRQGYALVVTARACPSAVVDPPIIIDPPSSDITGVQLLLQDPVAGAQGYQVYRSQGDCSAGVEDFQLIGSTATTSYNDTNTQGGFEYAYRVRAVDGCGEGPISACQSIVSAAPCVLAPAFDLAGGNLAVDSGTCAASLDWSPAVATCPAATGVQYQVFRNTDPYFDPDSEAPLADNLMITQLSDEQAQPGLSHFYRVRAFDSLGNFSAVGELLTFSAVDQAQQAGTTYRDPLEDGNPMTRELLALATLQDPWRISDVRDTDDTFSYHNAPDNQSYPNQSCASLTTGPIMLGGAPQLSYQALFQLEADFDGVVVEISDDGGASWQDLPPAGGYPDGFAQTGSPAINACGYPASQGAFSGENPLFGVDGFDAYSTDLTAFAGTTVFIRWRFSSDPFVGGEGFFLDEIQVTDASQPLACDELVFRNGYE
jgi:hypothetical protein